MHLKQTATKIPKSSPQPAPEPSSLEHMLDRVIAKVDMDRLLNELVEKATDSISVDSVLNQVLESATPRLEQALTSRLATRLEDALLAHIS